MRALWIVFLIIVFGGCARYVTTDVSVFHTLQSPVVGMNYAIVPGAEQANSLEFQSYTDVLKSELNKRGMIEVPKDQARYWISMSYGSDGGEQVFTSTPVYGQVGVFGSFSAASVITRPKTLTYTGVTFNTPRYGIVGSETRSEILFSRFLSIDIVDTTSGEMRKVYEAKALSIGDTAMLVSVIPAMIQSVLEEFPGVSGTTRKSRQQVMESK